MCELEEPGSISALRGNEDGPETQPGLDKYCRNLPPAGQRTLSVTPSSLRMLQPKFNRVTCVSTVVENLPSPSVVSSTLLGTYPEMDSDDDDDNLPEVQPDSIIVPTAFDAYFSYNAVRAQTSNNVFSELAPPLSAEEYQEASKNFQDKSMESRILVEPGRSQALDQIMLELAAGFNIICYGYGSKRRLLNHFALKHCSTAGHVVVVNGFQPSFNVKELISSIESLPDLRNSPLLSNSIEHQAQRINQFFSKRAPCRDLYLIIHNIDAPGLRSVKAKTFLSQIALNPRIHLVASVDHINSPLLWSIAEASARKDDLTNLFPNHHGYGWLWHDLTTLTSYDFELAFADRTSLSGAHTNASRKARDAVSQATAISETAAKHVLASVTLKAKKLFYLMGQKQLEAIEGDGDTPATDLQQYAMAYGTLFNMARDNFIATSDTALRAMLGEFRDHNLIVGSQGGSGGEQLWIPLRRDRISGVLQSIESEVS